MLLLLPLCELRRTLSDLSFQDSSLDHSTTSASVFVTEVRGPAHGVGVNSTFRRMKRLEASDTGVKSRPISC